MRSTGSSMAHFARLAIAVIAAVACAGLATACGSSSDSGATAGQSQVGAQTGTEATSARTAGAQAAQAAGKPVSLPKNVTVGIVGFSSGSEAAMRLVHAGESAIRQLGWKYKYCDPQADPAKAATCAQSMLNKDVNVIFSVAHEPAAIARQLKEAKSRHIPWFNYGGDVANRAAFAASYAPDDAEMARTIDDYLFNQMKRKGVTSLAVDYNSAIGVLATRYNVLKAGLKAHPDIKVAGQNETDLTNPIENVSTAARTIATAHHDLGAYWTSIDFAASLVGKTVKATLKGAPQPIVTGFYGTHENLQSVRDGVVSGLVEEGLEATAWVTVDQAAELLARKTPPSQDPFVDHTYKLDFMKPVLITKTQNMPPPGKYPSPPADSVTFFTTKWAKEFTNAS
jgi:ABC-type sugar transport system substrate-binding protein